MQISDIFPFNEITDTTVSNVGDFVRIPKIFVKCETNQHGLMTRRISKEKIKGFHCHPAFMQRGKERDAILISKFPTSGTIAHPESKPMQTPLDISFENARLACQNLGTDFHVYNIYEHHLLALLMLIEYGTTDLKPILGGSSDAVSGDYRGITQYWGNINLWIDGIETDKNANIKILDNLGNGTFQSTGLTTSSGKSGYFSQLETATGKFFDLNDIFLAADFSQDVTSGSYGCQQDLSIGGENKFFISDTVMLSTEQQNPFSFSANPFSTTALWKLAKFSD